MFRSLRGTLQEKQCQDLPVEFETPVTDRKRSHDQLESLRQVQEARGKALMDFEEECGGHLGDDSDAAADVALQNGYDALSFGRKDCGRNVNLNTVY